MNTNEILVMGHEIRDNLLILLRCNSAGTVNERAAFFQVPRCTGQYSFLQNGELFRVSLGDAPFYFGISPEGAETRAQTPLRPARRC